MIRVLLSALLLGTLATQALAGKTVFPEYREPRVVFDFFFADPGSIDSGLYWIRSFMKPLTDEPYDMPPEAMNIVVVVHGTEIVTLAKHNYEKYRDAVERMRYYASLGVHFKVCGIAAQEYAYDDNTFYDFVEIVPSAMTELAHWQQQGYGLVIPQILEKRHTIEDIR